MLSSNERKVLKALESGSATGDDLGPRSGLSPDAALSAAFQLQQKGLVDIREEKRLFGSLTEDGRKYAKKGLPERRLLEFLIKKKRENEFLNPRQIVDSFPTDLLEGIEIPWAIRNLRLRNWIREDEGRFVPTFDVVPSRDEDEQQKTLEDLLASEEAGRREMPLERIIAGVLERRGLIRKAERTSRTVSLSPAGRRALAEGAEEAREEIGDLTRDLLKGGGWRGKTFRPYDVTLPAAPLWPGKRNPYSRLLDELRQIFLEMGFLEIRGDIVQPAFWNFDALFQPQDHSARDMHDTFYLEGEAPLPPVAKRVKAVHESGAGAGSRGWRRPWDPAEARKLVLRTHTTAVTIRHLAAHPEPPVRAFCIDRVYRRENADPTHLPEFDQLEGVVLEEGANFRHLLGLLKEFYRRAEFPKARFRPGYFPYTEPSLEVEVEWKGRWVELGGAGIFRKEVLAPLGIKQPVLAWGLGVGRLAMMRLGLDDLRALYQPDIGWLREFPVAGRRT